MKIKILLLLSICLSYQAIAQKINYDSLSRVRQQLEVKLTEAYRSDDRIKAIPYLKKLAETDRDTLLIAARAYGQMSNLFSYADDSVYAALAKAKQLELINQSLNKYPDNMQAYIDRLAIYKFAEDKTGEKEFIKLCEEKFGHSWEMNFELCYHYVLYDFLWKDTDNYAVAHRYLMKAYELNPKNFNTLFLLATSEENSVLQETYFRKMYELEPGRFSKTINADRKAKYPYTITTKLQGKDLMTYLTKKQCQSLKLML